MWGARYWGINYWGGSYWGKVGGVPVVLPPPPWTIPEAGGAGTVRVIRRRGRRW